MLGAIIGDIVGSRFQFLDYKSKEFEFFEEHCVPTDDSFMTLAVAASLVICREKYGDVERVKSVTEQMMKGIANDHKNTGWGGNFYKWLFCGSTFNESYGNGAGMRVSPVGWVADTEDEVKSLSKAVTEISHNHPEGLRGAECVAMAVFLARTGVEKSEIRARLIRDYYPELADMTVENIRVNYGIDDGGSWVTCRGSIPQAMTAFFESTGFEDAIRNAISLGGDADTIGCMTGAVAEAYYGVSRRMEDRALSYLSDDLKFYYYAFDRIKKPRVLR